MSSGKVHARASVVGGLVASFAAPTPTLALCLLGGSVSGILLSPDLDQQTNSWIENRMVRSRFIPVAVFGHLWMAFWMPYAKSIKHRSPWSHWIGLGTAVRLLYISAAVVVLGACSPALYERLGSIVQDQRFGWWLIGLFLSDTLHAVFDFFDRRIKNVTRRFRR